MPRQARHRNPGGLCGRGESVSATVADSEFPLVLSGDHSIAIGTAGGVADEPTTGIVWFDAHADFNTPTGNVHGMPLAAILSAGPFANEARAHTLQVRPENIAFVGIRDLDDAERDLLREGRVSAYTMTDIDERGITDVVEAAVDVSTAGVKQVHVGSDTDCLNSNEAPDAGTPALAVFPTAKPTPR